MYMHEGIPNRDETLSAQQIRDFIDSRNKKSIEDLHALADLYNITIIREARYLGVPTIVVEGQEGIEVHVGYPEGVSTSRSGNALPAAATGKIDGIKMKSYGHGEWRYSIDV